MRIQYRGLNPDGKETLRCFTWASLLLLLFSFFTALRHSRHVLPCMGGNPVKLCITGKQVVGMLRDIRHKAAAWLPLSSSPKWNKLYSHFSRKQGNPHLSEASREGVTADCIWAALVGVCLFWKPLGEMVPLLSPLHSHVSLFWLNFCTSLSHHLYQLRFPP